MELRIAENKDVAEDEPKVNMWLERKGDNVELKARGDKICGDYTILVFKSNGKFYRAGCVPEALGFSVEAPKGRIVETE